MEEMTFKPGDKVRDNAELGGEILTIWGDAAKVKWNNGQTGWIDTKFLHHALTAA